MLYQVVFTEWGACGGGSKEIETVTVNAGRVDRSFWQQVQGIIKRRKKVHPVVSKWAKMSACELKKASLGLTVTAYEAARHPYTKQVERCRCVYRNKS